MFKLNLLILIVGVSLVLGITGYCGYKVHTLSAQQERVKEDYSDINNISFGILSVNQWRDKIVAIVSARIQNFQFTKEQQDNLEKEIEQILKSLIDKAVGLMEKPKKSIGGKLKKIAFNTFVNKDDLYKQVPVFAEKIVDEIQKPSSKQRLSNLAESELEQLEQNTYDSSKNAEKNTIDSILSQYHVADANSFETTASTDLSTLRQQTYTYAFGMLGGVLIILLLWWLLRNKPELYAPLYIMSILSAVILLLVGLTTTMIEIDARIKTLDFHLLGETISFKNQVLFFQSKSIVDVVKILIKTGKYDSVIVGVLILCFSVLFPVTKLLSAGIYLLSKKKWAKNKFTEYFAFKSGKWSMADVMVIAILMTYIGFNGILESQLADLNIHDDTLTSITTNNTSLQPGYIVFTGFVLYGLILSQILKKITHHE